MPGGTYSKRAGVFIAAQVAANAIGFITPLVIARYLSKESVGNYQQLWLVYTFLSQMLIMGLPSSLTYFYPTVDEKYKATAVYVVVGGLFLMGAVLGTATYLAAPAIANYFGADRLVGLVKRFFLFYAFTLGNSYMRRFLVSTNRYRFLMFWMPFDRIMNLLAFSVPAILGYDLEVMVTAGVITSGIEYFVALGFTVWVISPRNFVWKSDLVRRILFYSLPIGLSAASAQISRSIDRLVIGYFEDTEFFATFSWAGRSVPSVSIIAASAMTVLIPELARLHKEGNFRQFATIWHESIRKVSIATLAIFAFLEFMAGPYIVALYTDSYVGSVVYLRVYLLSMLMRVTMFGYVMQAIGRPRYILYVTLGSLTIKSFLSVGMYKLFCLFDWGPMGPPIASLMMSSAVGAFYLRVISRQLSLRPRNVWPWRTYGRNIAAAVIAGASTLLVHLVPTASIIRVLTSVVGEAGGSASPVALVRIVMGATVFVPVYVVLLHFGGILKPKDWQLLKDMTIGRFKSK